MAPSVLDYFIQQVSRYPEKNAVVGDNKHLTYRQLDEASSALCALLLRRGVAPGSYVPLVTLRTPEILIGMLAIVKAGAGYIPIDARYPEKRIQDIVTQSGSPLILASNATIALSENNFNEDIIYIDNISISPQENITSISPPPDAIVYLIFTSGTTGKPKGVLIEHQSLLNLILWHNKQFAMDAESRSTLIAGLSFDVAQWEIWSPLTSGGTLYLPPEDARLQPEVLLAYFAEQGITHASLPAVLVADVVGAPQPANLALRYLFSSGEKLHPVDLRGIDYPLIDYYGPTEATIFVTCNRVACATQNPPTSIGRPIGDTEIFILDDRLQPVIGDRPGELYISGRCLARGYLNNPALTAERFITPPHFAGLRLYRSGDRARWLADGRIQYLGRIDDQVKIRGNRIELGEIENAMLQVAGVRKAVAAVAMADDPLGKKIVAFLIAESDGAKLPPRQRLEAVLQRYRIALNASQHARIHMVPGNVAEHDFSLTPAAYRALSRDIDLVYHSASAVNFIQPYAYMKRDNVQGLREIIRFAAHSRTKPLMLLSTISVYSWGHLHTGKRVMRENDDIDQNLPAVSRDIGYVRSKWVMEKIADLAAKQGLPLMTFRLGYATCHSRTGVNADYQWWGRLVKTCISSGTVPDLRDMREGLTTVDYMTQAIAHVSRNPQALGQKFNLIHQGENNLTLREFFSLLEREFGYRFRPQPFAQWRAQWENDSDAPLYPLLSLFKDPMVDELSTVELYQDTYRWDCSNLQRFLQGSGIDEPRFTRQLLLNYLQHAIGNAPLSLRA